MPVIYYPAPLKEAERFVNYILNYESDTFSASASRITRKQAERIAGILIKNKYNNIDGVTISAELSYIRAR